MPENWNQQDAKSLAKKLKKLKDEQLTDGEKAILAFALDIAKDSLSTSDIHKKFRDAYHAGADYAAAETDPAIAAISALCSGIH